MSHFGVFKHRFVYIFRSLTIPELINMSPCIGCATSGGASSLFGSYRTPDKHSSTLNPFYSLLQGLKDAYKNASNVVKDAGLQFAENSRYNLKPVVNPAYAANYNSANSAGDFYRQASSIMKESPWGLHQP
jgi:hypothetical protein